MRFSHCLLPSDVRGDPGQNQKLEESSLFWRFSQKESRKFCCVNFSWLETRHRKHKAVTSRHRRRVGAMPAQRRAPRMCCGSRSRSRRRAQRYAIDSARIEVFTVLLRGARKYRWSGPQVKFVERNITSVPIDL
jgi:hypothetical protein